MTYEEAIDLCKNNPKVAANIIVNIEETLSKSIEQMDKLEQRIKELEDKLGMDSTNSSKPPSTDNKFTKKD